jgi:DNA-binding response OmpR family regulator
MRTVVALGSMDALDVSDSDEIDVVVTDVKLTAGEPHSPALARMIRRRPQVPIILMNACRDLLKEDVGLSGAALCKPLEIAELCQAIRVRQAQ